MMIHNDSLKHKLKQAPEHPGIYKMLDSRGNIIYIGKSKCLKRRVGSYFTSSHKWEKNKRMVSLIKDIEYIITDTHLEARLLECELIKIHKPHFNAQMKNDQRYVYLKVLDYNKNNPLTYVHQREEDSFGPFRNKYYIEKLISSLKNLYPISKCPNGYHFEYHLIPVTMDCDTFDCNRKLLLELFTEDERIMQLIEAIELKMKEAAAFYHFEAAALFRDLIENLLIIKHGLNGYKKLTSKEILLQIPVQKGFKLFYVYQGQIVNKELYPVLNEAMTDEFINHSKRLLQLNKANERDEKSRKDFRDILYSEIISLPEEWVFYCS